MKPTMDEMRQHIIDMMVRCEWNPGVSHKELAKQWGCAVRTVGDRALEASRVIQHNYPVKDWVAQAMVQLDQDAALARSLGKPRDAAYCIELQAKLLGALAPVKRQEVAPTGYETMTSEEKIQAHRQAILEEEQKLAEKEGRH